jgi:hypothetical protein
VLGGAEKDSQANAKLAAQLEEMGAPPEVVNQARGQTIVFNFAVWPENETALSLWLDMETQWRGQPMGLAGARPQGLDYTALFELMHTLGFKRKKREKLFRQLQVMERAALTALREQREAEQ